MFLAFRSSFFCLATDSMFSLKSKPTTLPLLPTCSDKDNVQSPVPQQTSSALAPWRTAICFMTFLRQDLCRWNEIMEFMESYLLYIFSNTCRVRKSVV